MGEHTSVTSRDLKMEFNNASTFAKSIMSNLTSQQILELYGLYKQATEGQCQKPKPSWYELTEKQKWDAWSSLKGMSSQEAMEKYVNIISTIEPNWEEKPPETLNAWVHHSCMKNNDEVIADSNKTIFDWVKEKNFEKFKMSSEENMSEINNLDDSGMGLLHWATDRGSLEIVKYLLENLKADVNIRDECGQTPLHYAVSCEYEDVEKYLVSFGADLNIRDNEGNTPYKVAK